MVPIYDEILSEQRSKNIDFFFNEILYCLKKRCIRYWWEKNIEKEILFFKDYEMNIDLGKLWTDNWEELVHEKCIRYQNKFTFAFENIKNW